MPKLVPTTPPHQCQQEFKQGMENVLVSSTGFLGKEEKAQQINSKINSRMDVHVQTRNVSETLLGESKGKASNRQ